MMNHFLQVEAVDDEDWSDDDFQPLPKRQRLDLPGASCEDDHDEDLGASFPGQHSSSSSGYNTGVGITSVGVGYDQPAPLHYHVAGEGDVGSCPPLVPPQEEVLDGPIPLDGAPIPLDDGDADVLGLFDDDF